MKCISKNYVNLLYLPLMTKVVTKDEIENISWNYHKFYNKT